MVLEYFAYGSLSSRPGFGVLHGYHVIYINFLQESFTVSIYICSSTQHTSKLLIKTIQYDVLNDDRCKRND